MKVFVRKMSSLGLLKFKLIIGAIVMSAAIIVPPVGIACIDFTLFLNPYIWLVFLAADLFFGAVGFFFCVRPYIIYRSLPEVMAETDGEYLYIHTKKEAKIPISEIEFATLYVDLPYSLVQRDFLSELIVHLGSEKYGTVILELSGHGNYKMPFASNAQESGDRLIGFIKEMIEDEDAR